MTGGDTGGTTGGDTGGTTGGTTGGDTGGTTGSSELPQLRLNSFSTVDQRVPTDLTHADKPVLQNYQVCSPVRLANRRFRQQTNGDDAAGWVLALDPTTPYAFDEDNESVILAAPLTKFASAENKTVILKEGVLTVVTGANLVRIAEQHGFVVVPAYSAVTVSQSRFGIVEVATLNGDSAEVQLHHGGSTADLQVKLGRQLTVRSSAVALSGASDYAVKEQAKLENTPVPGLNVLQNGSGESAVSSMRRLRRCRLGCLLPQMRNRLEDVLNNMEDLDKVSHTGSGLMPPQNRELNSIRSQQLKPISYSESSAEAEPASKRILSFGTESATVKFLEDASAAIDSSGKVDVRNGQVLIWAKKDTIIVARDCEVSLRRGAAAVVSSNDHSVKVFSVFDRARDSVSISVKGKVIPISVGREATVAEHERVALSEMSNDKVSRRRVRVFTGADGESTVCTSEFSIISLLQNMELAKTLHGSSDKSDRKMISDIMKLAVCLFQTTVSHGGYKQVAQSSNQGF
jgi:hypothetical protein